MRFIFRLGQVLAACSTAAAVCTSGLVIDNFSKFSSNTNSLGEWTSDDGSMTSISASGGILTFTPKTSSSYFYETFPCQAATTKGYNAVSFTLKGPVSGGSFIFEIQTKASCSATAYTSTYITVPGVTTTSQVITVPLSSFSGANANAITGFVWQGFSKTAAAWQLSKVEFCTDGGGSASSSSTRTSTSTTRSVSSTSTSVSVSVTSRQTTSTTTSVPSSTRTATSSSSSVPAGSCSPLVVDDWESQSRLTFLYYNALYKPTSDDGSMKSIVVSNNNRVTLTPTNSDSYFYSSTGCVNTVNKYGGISLRIKAAAGTTFSVQLGSPATCGGEDNKVVTQTTAQLGWTFDGTEKLYNIPFSKFATVDFSKLQTIFFGSVSKAVTFGPMALYCGNTVTEYVVPPSPPNPQPTSTVPAPAGTAAALVIDAFASQESNALGFWHGGDEGMTMTWGANKLTLAANDPDYSFYTQLSATCKDMTQYDGSYLHIAYTGSNKFTIALQQHNEQCNENIAPYPETWDSLEAARYATGNDIYIPMSHFKIIRKRVVGIAIKSFYTADPVTLTKIEIVKSIPANAKIPNKLPSGNLMFACKRPNSFAFAIDDGDPTFAKKVMADIKAAGIKVTFFTVGAPLEDPSTNLSSVYQQMKAEGHQIALHSFTHPKMEGLPDYEAIDWEYNEDIKTVAKTFNGLRTSYFRPPFGNEGARMRQRLTVATGDPEAYLVNWSVDVEDWLWATTTTPEKQLDAFKRDVAKGGNLVVLHYLYESTVNYLPEFIRLAKATGKQLMRVDQCMMDPNAPPL